MGEQTRGAIQRGRGPARQLPLFIQSLSAEEKRALEAGLQSRDAFTLRRSQILLARARGHSSSQITEYRGCRNQTVLNALHAFQREGLGCLKAKSSTPKRVQAIWSKERDNELRELLHHSPRLFGKRRLSEQDKRQCRNEAGEQSSRCQQWFSSRWKATAIQLT